MSDAAGRHPTPEDLAAFDLGRLPAEARAAVESHIAQCDLCWRQLETVPEDDLVALLRSSADRPAAVADTDDFFPNGRTVARSAEPEIPPALCDHPRYRVLGLLGAGGMGAVYKAEHRLMERVVALKVLKRSLTDEPAALERFRQEVKASARLAHPNIVTAYDADQAGDVHFLVMEFVEGESLDRVLRKRGPLPVGQVCDWARQAALGLQHASERGMVHRDVKPANLLLTPDGRVKILDFGLARFASERFRGPLTQSGAVVGTPDYIAPEQALDARTADARADVYGLGCTLYHLLAGRPPFPEGDLLPKLMAHQSRAATPLAEVRPDVPPELARVVERMMAKDPAERQQTPAEVAEDLAPFADATPPPGAVAASAPTVVRADWSLVPEARPRPRAVRRLWPALAAGVLILAGAGVGAYFWLHGAGGVRTPDDRSGPPDRSSIRPLRVVGGAAGPFTAVAVDHDGLRGLSAGPDNAVYIWDLESGEEVCRLPGHTDTVTCLAISLDGKRGISGSRDKTVRVWDLEKKQPIKTLTRHANTVYGVTFAYDNRHAVSAGNDGLIVLWDTEERRAKFEFAGNRFAVNGIALNRFGVHLATADSNKLVHLWDMDERRQIAALTGHTDAVNCAAWSHDARFLLSGGADGTARLWRFSTEREMRLFRGHDGEVTAAALSPDGLWAATGGADRTVRLWDIEEGTEVARLDGHSDAVLGVSFSGDSRRVVSGSKDGTFRVWRAPEGLRNKVTSFTEIVNAVAASPDGKFTAIAWRDERVRIFEPGEKKDRFFLKGHTSTIICLAVSPDGKTVASGGWDRTVRLWDATTGDCLRTLEGHTGVVRAVAFASDGKTLASGGADGLVKLWEVDSGVEKAALEGHDGAVRCVAFSRDDETLATGGADQTVRLWDVKGRRPTATLHGHGDLVNSVAFTPDGKTLASASSDRTIRLWPVREKKEPKVVKGSEGAVWSVAVSPDGTYVASGGDDRVIRLWALPDGRAMGVLDGHATPITAVCFSGSNRNLAVGSLDGQVKYWEVTLRPAAPQPPGP
jgi:WD40 repeat protein